MDTDVSYIWRKTVVASPLSVQRDERSIVIAGVIGAARALVEDEPLGTAILPGDARGAVVLAVPSRGEPSLAILERAPSDVARERLAAARLDRGQHLMCALEGRGRPRLGSPRGCRGIRRRRRRRRYALGTRAGRDRRRAA